MTLPRNSGSSSIISKIFLQTFTRCSLWSSLSSFGTIFHAHFPHHKVVSQDGSDSLPVHSQLICKHPDSQSLHTRVLTLSMWCAVFDVEGRPGFGSSSISSQPLLKRLCHSKTLAHDIQSAPQIFCSNWKHSAGFFPSFTRNFKLTHCSIFLLKQICDTS